MESKEIKTTKIISLKGRIYNYPARPKKLGRKPTVHHPDFKYKERKDYIARPRTPKGFFKLKRLALLETAQWQCSQCGERNNDLDIHHKDGNGYGKTEHPNDKLDNLVVLCTKCHQRLHHSSQANDMLILHLREDGLTYEKIGRMLGISRQRVHQLAKRAQSS